MYNGSFYYHQQGDSRVIRYELNSERKTMVDLPNATISDNLYLYTQVPVSFSLLPIRQINSSVNCISCCPYCCCYCCCCRSVLEMDVVRRDTDLNYLNSLGVTWTLPSTRRACGWFTELRPTTTRPWPSSIPIPWKSSTSGTYHWTISEPVRCLSPAECSTPSTASWNATPKSGTDAQVSIPTQ